MDVTAGRFAWPLDPADSFVVRPDVRALIDAAMRETVGPWGWWWDDDDDGWRYHIDHEHALCKAVQLAYTTFQIPYELLDFDEHRARLRGKEG